MKINLSDITDKGKNFKFSRKDGDLNEVLKDLVGQSTYRAEIDLVRQNSHFKLSGEIVAEVKDTCSKCGTDIAIPLKKSFSEVLVEESTMQRGDQIAKSGEVDVSSPDFATYKDMLFDAGEFLHEALALVWPSYPLCGGDTCKHQTEADSTMDEINKKSEKFAEKKGHPGFKKLKDLKIN